ncbi:MAG TPA: NADH-quinone oxidoreductase subunit H [Candidatus Polarisedimenticolia bacterium]|nr:NADH-quinone oxidoreductase subunit H [Candidatus Polarisedimenticolia bacterium]
MIAPAAVFLLGLALAPLTGGLIVRVKSLAAGRTGPPILQPYFDLARLWRKGTVRSTSTSWVFASGSVITAAATAAALALVPAGGVRAPLAFAGDAVLLVGLLALGRFAMVLSAMDTGSSFEGMGASRETAFSALAEPVLMLVVASVARASGGLSLSEMLGPGLPAAWGLHGASLALAAAALFVILLAENARIPVDDPATHLELTMIHEVMLLDHSGPDLALMEYASALKLWIFGALLAGLAVPVRTGWEALDLAAFLAGTAAAAAVVGLVESSMARLQLARVPQLVVGAGALAAFGVVLGVRA